MAALSSLGLHFFIPEPLGIRPSIFIGSRSGRSDLPAISDEIRLPETSERPRAQGPFANILVAAGWVVSGSPNQGGQLVLSPTSERWAAVLLGAPCPITYYPPRRAQADRCVAFTAASMATYSRLLDRADQQSEEREKRRHLPRST